MPKTEVIMYAEEDDTCPLIMWLDGLPPKVQDKCIVRIERLAEMGYELHRPEADYLRDKIYELRVAFQRVQYRILYFFHDDRGIISHGLIKEDVVPSKDIDLVVERMDRFKSNPQKHTYRG